MQTKSHLLSMLLAAALLGGCGDPPPDPADQPASGLTAAELAAEPGAPIEPLVAADAPPGDYADTEWDALVPPGWSPDQLISEYDAEQLEDDDPRAQELLAKLKTMWQDAPVVPGLDGRRIRLPGFVVPLDGQGGKATEFLLVPYYGACIHVPPPPANQTVLVNTRPGGAFDGELFDAVWVSGTLRVTPTSSELAEAGYLLEDATVTPYE